MKTRKELTIPATANMFQEQYHIFRMVIRKRGSSSTNSTAIVPDGSNRFASKVTVLKLGKLSPPQMLVQYV